MALRDRVAKLESKVYATRRAAESRAAQRAEAMASEAALYVLDASPPPPSARAMRDAPAGTTLPPEPAAPPELSPDRDDLVSVVRDGRQMVVNRRQAESWEKQGLLKKPRNDTLTITP